MKHKKQNKKKDKMSYYDNPKQPWEFQRNKTLQNLMIILEDFSVVKDCAKEDRPAFRQELIREIMKMIGCSKRTAYDYVLALEDIYSWANYGYAKNVLIGGKRSKK